VTWHNRLVRHRGTIAVTATVLLLAGAGGAAAVNDGASFGSGAVWHYDTEAPNKVKVLQRTAGVAGASTDDTVPVVIPGGPPLTSSGYQTVDLTPYGVPADAEYAQIGVKAVITKGSSDGTDNLYVFLRTPGANCCLGPVGYDNYPVAWGTARTVRGLAEEASVWLAKDSVREFNNSVVALRNGRFQFAWGYQRNMGDWPDGDSVAIVLYVNGYAN
jgi:hypothetical protein